MSTEFSDELGDELSDQPDNNFEIAPWRSPLARALHRNRSQPFCRFFQLATVRADYTPANRTVVFRGFLEQSDRLMMISDRRSQKTDQLQQNPNVEACWYFTKTREQFRLSGTLTLITADTLDPQLRAARQQLWQKISANARLQFAWPQPKAPRINTTNTAKTVNADDFEPPAPDANTPLPTFCLGLLTPHTVDYLCLRGAPQTRILYQKQTRDQTTVWSRVEVNP